jgi:hypothetical protein
VTATVRDARGNVAAFATLDDVVNHYDTFLNLGLSEQQKHDLVEYLKSP